VQQKYAIKKIENDFRDKKYLPQQTIENNIIISANSE